MRHSVYAVFNVSGDEFSVRFTAVAQSGSSTVDEHLNAPFRSPVVAETYNHSTTHDYANAHRLAAESVRDYRQPDAAHPSSSLRQLADVAVLSGAARRPTAAAATGQIVTALQHDIGNLRCETCSRPAMFVCSACRKAPYCSEDCQVCRLSTSFVYTKGVHPPDSHDPTSPSPFPYSIPLFLLPRPGENLGIKDAWYR